MSYVDGFVVAVPEANKEAYRQMAQKGAEIFMEFGAIRMVECWGNDVPDGKVTDFKRAVKAEDGEKVVFSWIVWPDKQTRDEGMRRSMEDSRMNKSDMPFDGKRMIYGGFDVLFDSDAGKSAARPASAPKQTPTDDATLHS